MAYTTPKTYSVGDVLTASDMNTYQRDNIAYLENELFKPYAGVVNADGTAARLPVGWSSARNSTGNYTVTHNLGDSIYVVVLTPYSGNRHIPYVSARANNTFTVIGTDAGGTATDMPFGFILYE